MVRPKKNRRIRSVPQRSFFKPSGISLQEMKGVTLSLEGFEALRLIDGEGVSREQAARMMDVSPSTLCRILAEARNIVAKALANGWALRIEGGDYVVADTERGQNCGQVRHRCHRGKGRHGKQ